MNSMSNPLAIRANTHCIGAPTSWCISLAIAFFLQTYNTPAWGQPASAFKLEHYKALSAPEKAARDYVEQHKTNHENNRNTSHLESDMSCRAFAAIEQPGANWIPGPYSADLTSKANPNKHIGKIILDENGFPSLSLVGLQMQNAITPEQLHALLGERNGSQSETYAVQTTQGEQITIRFHFRNNALRSYQIIKDDRYSPTKYLWAIAP